MATAGPLYIPAARWPQPARCSAVITLGVPVFRKRISVAPSSATKFADRRSRCNQRSSRTRRLVSAVGLGVARRGNLYRNAKADAVSEHKEDATQNV